jgi:hypothetical protein
MVFKNNVHLPIIHFDKKRVEYFLNSIDHTLEPTAFDQSSLQHSDEILGCYAFTIKSPATNIVVIFATSYAEANAIGIANKFEKRLNTTWTVNGDILYVVESSNHHHLNKLISHFAGLE